MSQSPRNMSPILSKTNPSQQFETEEMRKKSILNEDDDLKKIELIRQRMDLMNEQTKLKELLDQQEDMLKEKQVFRKFISKSVPIFFKIKKFK